MIIVLNLIGNVDFVSIFLSTFVPGTILIIGIVENLWKEMKQRKMK